jgi:serine/threonine protein phosphatase PrpC
VLSTTVHASAQLTGTRSHQCDATATHATTGGGRAFVLLDGIGSSTIVRAWTRAKASRLAELAARSLQAGDAITALQEEIQADPKWADKPGACGVAAVTGPDAQLRIGWIGDCRAYMLHPGGYLTRLTAPDHNLRAVLEADGRPVPTWARNIVTRCLGHPEGGAAMEPDRTAVHDRIGIRLLLASDGAYEPLEDSGTSIADLLAGGTPREAANRLVAAAVEHADPDNTDNATVLVADFT